MMNLQETNKSSCKTRNVSHFKGEKVNAKREREREQKYFKFQERKSKRKEIYIIP